MDFTEIKAKRARAAGRKAKKDAKRESLGPKFAKRPKAKKTKRPPSRKKQTDACKKRILGVGGLWSQTVRARDGKCLMCGKTEGLQAHHWLFRRGHSMALAVDHNNGSTLCYGCHIGRVHHDGDGDFIYRLGDTMTALVGADTVAAMRLTAKVSQPLSLEWWLANEDRLTALLAALKGEAKLPQQDPIGSTGNASSSHPSF